MQVDMSKFNPKFSKFPLKEYLQVPKARGVALKRTSTACGKGYMFRVEWSCHLFRFARNANRGPG